MRRAGLLAGVLAGAMGCAWAQTGASKPLATTVVEPPTPLVQGSDRLVPPSPQLSVPDDTVEAQAILKEDGLLRKETRMVTTAGAATPAGWVKGYQFGDATGAFAAYTYFRGTGSHASTGGKANATDVLTSGGERVFLSGTSVVRAAGKPEALGDVLKKVEIGLPKIGGRRGLAPLLPTLFPADVEGARLDASTLHYALGSVAYQSMGGSLPPEILGWDKSAEVATAVYTSRRGARGLLTLLMYPTPEIAGDRGRAIESAINARGIDSFGTVKMRRLGPLVGVTSGAFPASQAQALVTALKLNQMVTFDKKMPLEFHAEVRKTATLLQSIAVFTGLLILAAIVLGVFLGGARAGIRVLRGKPAASEPEFLTINLRDKPKALFAPKEPDAGDPKA